MPTLFAIDSFRTYALCCALLALNLITLANLTPLRRAKKKGVLNPEDLKVGAKGAKVIETEDPEVARVQRAHRNALENIPMFFAIGLLYALSAPSAMGAKIYFFTYTASRWIHSLVYLGGLQPWRTISFVVGLLCLVGMTVHVLLAAIA